MFWLDSLSRVSFGILGLTINGDGLPLKVSGGATLSIGVKAKSLWSERLFWMFFGL